MSEKHDKQIIELQKEIEKKEKETIIEKPTLNTNCKLELDDVNYNLHVLNKDKLIYLLVKLNGYLISLQSLNMHPDDLKFNGFNVLDWISDINAKIRVLENKEKIKELNVAKEQLQKLLSEDKKTELEIEKIAKLLK